MDAHRVQVLHVADGDGGIVLIPHHFVFDFLKALDAFLNQHFPDGRKLQGVFHQRHELCFIVRKAAAGATQGKGGAQDDRVTDLFRDVQAVFHGTSDIGRQHRFP